jgi:hypothetical protein
MSDKYTHAAERVRHFFARISAEADAIGADITAHAENLGRITKQDNPAEFDSILKESAADLDLFAQRIEDVIPSYQRNLELLTEGFTERIKSLQLATADEARELQAMRREAQALAGTANEVKAKVTALRSNFAIVRDSDHDPRLTKAAHRVITAIDNLFTAYEDLETFALNVCFSAEGE